MPHKEYPYQISRAQIKRIWEMLQKSYVIGSLRFDPMEGHLTAGVRVKRGMRYFTIRQNGKVI